MNFLLKIVEGPMKGAEIALVGGLRVRVGSGADCDIVLADAALPEAAFELDVSAESVSLIRGEDVKTLVPFEIFDVGTSAFAIGPAEGAWEPLKKAVPVDAASSPRHDGSPISVDAASSPRQNEESSSSADAEGTPRPPEAGASPRPDTSRHHGLLACCCVLVVLLALAAAAWYFWPTIVEKYPPAETARVTCVGWFRSACDSHAQQPPAPAAQVPTLADLARQYNLILANAPTSKLSNSPTFQPVLRGNFARRTERMAVRALALAVDPRVKLELTDDETLRMAANELLFVVTEGAVKVASASNGVVAIVGYAPSASSLERTIRALNADVKGIDRVVTAGVAVGGTPPPELAASVSGEKPLVFSEAPPAKKAPRARGTKTNPVRDYPIAGILTKPYPMVVLNSGMRLTEGAQIADVVVQEIKADRLVLRCGSTTFEWKP